MDWYDQKGSGPPDPSLAEFQTWQKPSDLIAHLPGQKAQNFINGLLQRLENGFLFAAAGISSWRDERGRLQTRHSPVSIQADWWQDADGVRQHWEPLWILGDVNVRVYDISRGEFIQVALTEVRFEASGLYNTLKILRPVTSALSVETVTPPSGVADQPRLSQQELDAVPKHAGGRPPKHCWEPLLIATGIAIYAGFQPGRIADVERWMADWLEANGYSASEGAVRDRARALFNAYVAERDKN